MNIQLPSYSVEQTPTEVSALRCTYVNTRLSYRHTPDLKMHVYCELESLFIKMFCPKTWNLYMLHL